MGDILGVAALGFTDPNGTIKQVTLAKFQQMLSTDAASIPWVARLRPLD
jgi:hypothetical protein